jgi:hypothetical protein
VALGVNPDASLFCRAPGSDLVERRAASPCLTILVALSGALKRAVPGSLGAIRGTINLAAIAAAADHNLQPAARAEEQPRRRCLDMERQHAWWTNATIARILTLHTCPARCGAKLAKVPAA